MNRAMRLAQQAADAGEVPVGALIVLDGRIIGQAHNQTELLKDPTAHAEMLSITQACAETGNWRLENCTLYVTKEPCPMCAGAIILARLPRVVWGVNDPKRGGALSNFKILDDPNLNHRPECVHGVEEDACRAQIQNFFRRRRQEKAESKP